VNDSKFKAGQIVEAYDDRSWRKAWIEEPKYYHKGGCWGAYVHWLSGTEIDPITHIKPSQCGWKPEYLMREVENGK
jgi:hypothetical protein